MARRMKIELTSRGVSCIARLLDEEAPRTAEAVWEALPQSGQVYHGKYARNEIYALVPPFGGIGDTRENTTVTPIPGDICYFHFTPEQLGNPAYGYGADSDAGTGDLVDLALFYGRNNLLINGDQGWIPGTVVATVEEGLDEMAAACASIWMDGARGETLAFSRLED